MRHRALQQPALEAASPAILVFRAQDARALAPAFEQRCPREAMILPAGPYRYPFAAALEIAQRLAATGAPADHSSDGVLYRAALARALAPLLRGGALVLPRADWLDTPSLDLLLDILRCNLLLGCPPLRLWFGLTDGELTPALQPLLEPHWAQLVDLAPGHYSSAPDTGELGRLLALAPQPLAITSLARLGVDISTLRGLSAAGLVHEGPRVGWGPAFECLELQDPQPLRQALAREGGAALPGARFALGGHSDSVAAAALARACWNLGEYSSAARYYHLSRLHGHSAYEMRCGLALIAAGYAQAAQAMFQQCKPPAADLAAWVDRGQLAARLATAGMLDPQLALKTMRKAERMAQASPGFDHIELLASRARLLLHVRQFKAAAGLLRRVSGNLLAQCPPRAQRLWLLQMAQCHAHAGSNGLAGRCLQRALDASETGPEKLEVALALHEHSPTQDSALAGATIALELFDPKALSPLLPHLSRRDRAQLGGRTNPAPKAQIEPMTVEAAWRWLRRWGATVLVVPKPDGVQIEPPEAAARPGLAAWLHAQVQRLQDHPDALYLPAGGVPNAGKFAGNLLALRRLGSFSPALVILARENEPDLRQFFAAIESFRDLP